METRNTAGESALDHRVCNRTFGGQRALRSTLYTSGGVEGVVAGEYVVDKLCEEQKREGGREDEEGEERRWRRAFWWWFGKR